MLRLAHIETFGTMRRKAIEAEKCKKNTLLLFKQLHLKLDKDTGIHTCLTKIIGMSQNYVMLLH